MNIPQSVLVAADKVMKTDFDRAYVHDSKIIVRKSVRRTTPIDEFSDQGFERSKPAVLPDTHPFVEQKRKFRGTCKVGCG